MEKTAAGIEAEIVIPTFKPKNAFAAVRIMVKMMARIVPLSVISGSDWLAGIYGSLSEMRTFALAC